MKTFYSSGLQLGPHRNEEKSSFGESFTKRVRVEFKKALSNAHHFSSALLLIAALSFGANMAFAYIGFVNQDLAPEIALFPNGRSLGSDDGNAGYPVISDPTGNFKTVADLSELNLSAESFIAADATTGEILLEKNADSVYPIASVTKIVSAVVAKEKIDQQREVVVSSKSRNTYGTEGGLSAGERLKISDLMYPLLMESSNDAAEVIADDYGRSYFIGYMNEKAVEIGMSQTFFVDPSGLSAENKSNSRDLLRLALYFRSVHPELLDITHVKQFAILNHVWMNKNAMIAYPNFIGGKNGYIDESKQTTISYFNLNFRSDNPDAPAIERPIAITLLRSEDRDNDTALLLSYIIKNIRYVEQVAE